MQALFPGASLSQYADPACGIYRCAAFQDGRLVDGRSAAGASAIAPTSRPSWKAAQR
jgi:assimilatory nitrate reductase catalytic subunit